MSTPEPPVGCADYSLALAVVSLAGLLLWLVAGSQPVVTGSPMQHQQAPAPERIGGGR